MGVWSRMAHAAVPTSVRLSLISVVMLDRRDVPPLNHIVA